ncbi:MAG: DUF4350 domain-containing protein [Muribaculaceae bacterium]|nr:DUF4350 domain-containing protein [Muribaculaceae bacterium]
MKANKVFLILVVVLFVVMVLAQMQMPKRFKWHTTFEHYDEQPFGCAVFDSVMAASALAGYSVADTSFFGLARARQNALTTYLLLKNEYYANNDVDDIKRLLNLGHNVVLAVGEIDGNDFEEAFGVGTGFTPRYGITAEYWYEPKKLLGDGDHDTITWVGGNGYKKRNYIFNVVWANKAVDCKVKGCKKLVVNSYNFDYQKDFESMHDGAEYEPAVVDEADPKPTAVQRHHDVLAVCCPVGRGKLIVTTIPHLFTNYGILDPQMRELGMRILSQAGHRPIVRIDNSLRYAGDEGEEKLGSQSPLRYLLDNPPLRWALYLTVMALLLFLFFTARRRQRVIPVVKEPDNQTMLMVNHIGTLYYERHDNADLLKKKYQYFTEQLRREVMVDIDDHDHLDTELETLAQLTATKPEELRDQVTLLHTALQADTLSNDQLKHLIGIMNDLAARL